MTRLSPKLIIMTAVLGGALSILGSDAEAQGRCTVLRRPRDKSGRKIKTKRGLRCVRINRTELQTEIDDGAELVTSDGDVYSDGKTRETTSFLGALYAPHCDVTVVFGPPREVIPDEPEIEEEDANGVDTTFLYYRRIKKIGCKFKKEWFTKRSKPKSNNGHGNNEDGVDSSNPGQGRGGPNGAVDESLNDDDPDNDDDEIGTGRGRNVRFSDLGDDLIKGHGDQDVRNCNYNEIRKYMHKNFTKWMNAEVKYIKKKMQQGKLKGWTSAHYATLNFRKDGKYLLCLYSGVFYKAPESLTEGKCRVARSSDGTYNGRTIKTIERSEVLTAVENGDRLVGYVFREGSKDRQVVADYGYRWAYCSRKDRWNPETDAIGPDVMVAIQRVFQEWLKPYVNFKKPKIKKFKAPERYEILTEQASRLYFRPVIRSINKKLDKTALANLLGSYTEDSFRSPLTAAQRAQGVRPDINGERGESFYIRLGDVDGFGFGTGVGHQAANRGPANPDGQGILGTQDFMPDLNKDGIMATGKGDDFDHRDSAERSDASVSVNRCIDSGSKGSKFTDIALSTSWDRSNRDGKIHLANGSYGHASGAFPKGASTQKPNQPGMVFDFQVAPGVLVTGQTVFFNAVMSDFDVTPFHLILCNAEGRTIELDITRQANSGGEDGLIQAGYASLPFDFVFTKNSSGGFDGYLKVDIDAPREPWLAYDFFELSTEAIDIVPNANRLDVVGHLQFGPEGDETIDVTSHTGDLRKSETKRFVPDISFEEESTPLEANFGPGDHEIASSRTLENMILAPGAKVRIVGDVTLNVTGTVGIPSGATLFIGENDSLKLFTSGDLVVRGLIDNATAANLRIVSTQNADDGGNGVFIRLSGGRYLGSLVGRNIRLAAQGSGEIRFTFDKALATKGISESPNRLKVQALLTDLDD